MSVDSQHPYTYMALPCQRCFCYASPCCHRTVVDVKVLQLYDSMRLCNPTISMTGFLKAIADAAAMMHPTQVRPDLVVSRQTRMLSSQQLLTCAHQVHLSACGLPLLLSATPRYQRARLPLCAQRVQVLPIGPTSRTAAAERPGVPSMQCWHGWRAH